MHHLFPSMSRMNPRRARPIVKQYCDAPGIPYEEARLEAAAR